jgi:anti-anti-sigma factor
MKLAVSHDPDGHAVLAVSGEIDARVADELRDAGIAATGDGETALAIDLSQVTFIDSSGIAALIQIRNALPAQAANLTLVAPSRSVRRVLEVTGLTGAFTVVD